MADIRIDFPQGATVVVNGTTIDVPAGGNVWARTAGDLGAQAVTGPDGAPTRAFEFHVEPSGDVEAHSRAL
ncbi:MAG: hypothetical protein WC211_01210 [Dehalococcoidia bacterium]